MSDTETTLTLLGNVAAKLADETAWTQGVHARNELGEAVNAGDIDAVAWCLTGACYAVTYATADFSDLLEALHRALPEADRYPEGAVTDKLVTFNDTRDYHAVMQLVDRAITLTGTPTS